MKRPALSALLATVIALPFSPARAQLQPAANIEILETFAYPKANTKDTIAWALNNLGTVGGTFNHGFLEQGFLRQSSGKFSPPISASPTARNYVQAVNDAGVAAGYYVDTDGSHGFFFQDGVLTPYDMPGSTATIIYGLNNAGDFTGLVTNSGVTTAYASIGGTITAVSGAANATFTWPHAINKRDQLVGYYVDNVPPLIEHGFLRNPEGSIVGPLDFPGAANTQLFGINDRGTIVGFWYEEGNSVIHGLVLRHLTEFSQIDIPGASYTLVTGINNSGVITGWYSMPHLGVFGFLARLVE